MIKRCVALAAIAVACVCFWSVRRKFDGFAEQYCGYNEARGNCEAFHALAVHPASAIFVVAMVVLATVVILPGFRRSGTDD